MSRVNWSILFTPAEAEVFNDLVNDMRKITGRPALSKADVMRAMLKRSKRLPIRAELVSELKIDK